VSIITRMLKQTAVYWPYASIDQFGKKSWGTAEEISVRWVDVSEEFLDSEGERQVSKVKVYVEKDTPVGGVLMLGELTDITDEDDIKENNGAWEIRQFSKLPNFKATEFLRTAYL